MSYPTVCHVLIIPHLPQGLRLDRTVSVIWVMLAIPVKNVLHVLQESFLATFIFTNAFPALLTLVMNYLCRLLPNLASRVDSAVGSGSEIDCVCDPGFESR